MNVNDDGLQGLNLQASMCKKCGEIYFPDRVMCTKCKGREMERIDLKGEGKIYSYTWVYRTPPGVPGPYCLSLIDLAQKVRVWARVEVREGEVEVGQLVKLCNIDPNNVLKFRIRGEGIQGDAV